MYVNLFFKCLEISLNFFLDDMQTKVPKSEVMDASCPDLRSRGKKKKRITKNSRNDWQDKKSFLKF